MDTSLGYYIIIMILQEMWVVEQFHDSLRCLLKLIIQIFSPWSNHRYLTFLLRWFPLHAEIYLNPFNCFKLLPYWIYPHIYSIHCWKFSWSRRISRTQLCPVNHIHHHVYFHKVSCPFNSWPMNGILIILFRKDLQAPNDSKVKWLQKSICIEFLHAFLSNMT